MKDLLFLKLNKGIWVSLIRQKKIVEAINEYNRYNDLLTYFLNNANEEEKIEIQKELDAAKVTFNVELAPIAEGYLDEEDWSNALICYTEIFGNDINTYNNYLACLYKMKFYSLEKDVLKFLIEQKVLNDVFSYKKLARACINNKDYDEGIHYIKKYMEMNSDFVSADDYNLLGCGYHMLYKDSRDEEILKLAYENFVIASDMDPIVNTYTKNAIIALKSIDDDRKLLDFYWKRLVDSGNMNNDDKFDYACYGLYYEDYQIWWDYFEYRFEKESGRTRYPKINRPKWDGITDISDKTLLIHYEQGYGDTILCFNYIKRLKNLVKHIIFIPQQALYSLIKNNDSDIEVLPEASTDFNDLEFDYYLPPMSIPIVLKYKRDDIRTGKDYLHASDKLIKEYKEKYFNNDKLKIGISISGAKGGNTTRDVPIEVFLALEKLENVELYALTKDTQSSIYDIFKNVKVNNVAQTFNDFEHTAAAIENCDVIVSSDNGVMNLAGAIGKKTYALFNKIPDYRWFDLTGEDVVWYSSVKPFVNKVFDEWEPTMERVVEEIKANYY